MTVAGLLALIGGAWGNGVLTHGFGASDAGAAGAFGGTGGDALSAMQVNPAALAALETGEVVFSLRGGLGRGTFGTGGRSYDMELTRGFPEFALAWGDDGCPLRWGFSIAPLAGVEADWVYPDAPGGIGGISYGILEHDSSFSAVRTNVGLAWEPVEGLAVGLSLGAVQARVEFDAPFIFQTNPALAGAKVDLDLETEGWAPLMEFGVLWDPGGGWSAGLRARPQVDLDLDGSAWADFSAQLPPLGLGGAPPLAGYRAATGNALPAVVGGGVSWDSGERLRLGLWVDWVGWGDAFDVLEVGLAGGSNAAIDGAIGRVVSDRVPVGWRDRWVVAFGGEYQLGEDWRLRAGWRWGDSPAPSAWVTPLNAAILEHTLAVGVGWSRDRWRVDLSYEYRFGATEQVAVSGYRAGEYSASKVDLSAHVLGLGVARRF